MKNLFILFCLLFSISCGKPKKSEEPSLETQAQENPPSSSEQEPTQSQVPAPKPAPIPAPENQTLSDPANPTLDPRKKRIVFFGDSLTAGPGIGKHERYPERIQNFLDRENKPWEVVNAGVNGNTTADGLARIESVLTQYPADIVFICLGGNDFLQAKPIDGVKNNLDAIIQIVKVRGAKPILAGLSANGLLELAGLSFGSIMGDQNPNLYQTVFQDLKIKHSIPFHSNLLATIPGASAAISSGHIFDPDYMVDRIHPNARGHLSIALDVYKFLEPYLL